MIRCVHSANHGCMMYLAVYRVLLYSVGLLERINAHSTNSEFVAFDMMK